jgi:serralysin
VVCIAPGNYNISSTIYPSHSGTAADWITYTSYGTGAVNVVWTGANMDNAIFNMQGTFPNGPSYLSFNGLTLNGQNQISNGFFCRGSHHLTFTNNTISNMGAAGIASFNCDYMTSDHNTIFHSGYAVGWSSAISYAYLYSFDSYAGFHNIMSNNIVAGEYDASSHHTDGNGLILDDGGNSVPANTPASLIVNNVSYGNGGRCIEANTVSQAWIVNNTCYDNDLDTSQPNDIEVTNQSSNTTVFANNIVESWYSQPTYSIIGSGNSNVTYSHNLSYGGSSSAAPGTGYITADAQFVNPPAYSPTAGGQYANTISPSALGNGLDLQSTSPAINAGIDPTSLAGSNTAIKSDLSKYIYTDINGNSRPVGGPFTLGAYQK